MTINKFNENARQMSCKMLTEIKVSSELSNITLDIAGYIRSHTGSNDVFFKILENEIGGYYLKMVANIDSYLTVNGGDYTFHTAYFASTLIWRANLSIDSTEHLNIDKNLKQSLKCHCYTSLPGYERDQKIKKYFSGDPTAMMFMVVDEIVRRKNSAAKEAEPALNEATNSETIVRDMLKNE